MKIFSPFRLMNSPLVIASLGLQALNEGTEMVRQIHEDQQQRILAQSALTGEPVTSEPGSAIRHFASMATGGAISPDIQASGDTMLQENIVLQKQQQLREARELAQKKFDLSLQEFQERQRHDKVAEEQSSPQAKVALVGAEEQERLKQINSPENQQSILNLNRAKASQDAAIHESAALDTHARELAMDASPTGLDLFKRKEEIKTEAAVDRVGAIDRAKQDRLDATPISESRTNKAIGGVFVNKKTLKQATGAKGEPQTYKDARNNPDYAFVPNKAIEGRGGLNSLVSQVKNYDAAIAAIDAGEADDIFPDTSGMNAAFAKKAQLDYGTANYWERNNDPKRVRWYNMFADHVRFWADLQGRFPNTAEMKTPLVPDPGGIVPSGVGGAILHVGGANPLRIADAKQVARERLVEMRERALQGFSAGAGISPIEVDEDDTSEFTGALKKAGGAP